MTKAISFTAKDICSALDIGKHQLRNWTDKLEPYNKANIKERSARRYNLGDLHFLAVIDYLGDNFGIPTNLLIPISARLNNLVKSPVSFVEGSSLMHICLFKGSCTWMKPDSGIVEGLIVDINNAHKKVNEFLGVSPRQVELQLGLTMVN